MIVLNFLVRFVIMFLKFRYSISYYFESIEVLRIFIFWVNKKELIDFDLVDTKNVFVLYQKCFQVETMKNWL